MQFTTTLKSRRMDAEPISNTTIPGPPGGFLGFRHIGPMMGNFLDYSVELKKRYGDALRFSIGPVKFYIFSHPDHFREVLVQHPEDFRKPRLAARLMRPLLRG